jgi:Cu/Ag efflux protein CusF
MKGSRETASASQSQQDQHKSQGTIRSVDTSSKTLSLKGARMHRDIVWSDQTQVLRNGKEVSPEELKKGERVSVTFSKQGDQLIAQQIVIRERQQARTGRHHHRGY